MNSIMNDLRYAVRQLRRAPGFALTAVLTLALSIGVASAVFSVLDATIVRPLPYHRPDAIVMLQPYSPQGYQQPASYPQYLDWRSENTTLADLAGYSTSTANLEGPQGPSPVRTVSGTDNFFSVFGVTPILGRTFASGEDQPGRNHVVVLSYELWRQNFAGDPKVLGTSIRIDGKTSTIIGVMPAGFRFPLNSVNALYRPLEVEPLLLHERGDHWLPTVARLKPGVTQQQAQADLSRVFANVGRAFPDEANKRIEVFSIAKAFLGKTSGPLLVLTLAVFGILAIGCVNIAGLLLARGVRREREICLRSAVGATRLRLIRQLLTESAMLSLVGAACGTVLAWALLEAMRQLLIHSLARGADVQLNLTVLAVTLLISIATGVVAGIFPALHFSQVAPSLVLRSGGSAGTGLTQNRVRSVFIIVQVAIALSLLVCSSLLLRNLHSLRSTDIGFSVDNLLTEEIELTPANYTGRDYVSGFYKPLLERVRALPGVSDAGFINMVPIADSGMNSDVQIVGHPPAPSNQERLAEMRVVSPGVAGVFQTKLVRGRLLSDSLDTATTQAAVTVNQAFVDKFFSPGEDPIGKQLDRDHKPTIVGVTTNVRQDLFQRPMAEMDSSIAQLPEDWKSILSHMTLVVRTRVPPASINGALRQALHETDPTVPFRASMTMQDIISDTLTFERLESWLFGIFAGLALTLSLVGIYGMVHHEVELRTRDIGVRMALGATRSRVVGQILARVSLLMLSGIALGWVITLALRKVLASVIELHAAHDAALLIALTAVLAMIGIAASLLPARRAATIDPIQALRTE